jgi:hypothetical protein
VGTSLVSPVLVGREAELEALDGGLQTVLGGGPVTVLVGGEAGVGKSRLIAELVIRARAVDARALVGSCVEFDGGGIPFAPVVDMLRALAAELDADELEPLLGSGRAELGRLVPELDGGDTAPQPEDRDPSRILELMLGVVSRLAAGRPLLLVFEDLQWADRPTLDLIALLVAGTTARRLMVVLSVRSDELHRAHPVRRMSARWEQQRSERRLELERLTEPEVAAQITAIMDGRPEGDLSDVVFERSEGIPFGRGGAAGRSPPWHSRAGLPASVPARRFVGPLRTALTQRAACPATHLGGWTLGPRGAPQYRGGSPRGRSLCVTAPGQLSLPDGIAVDGADGSISVADVGNDRVETFSSAGGYESQFAISAAPSGLDFSSIALDQSDGGLYLTDASAQTITRFGVPPAPSCDATSRSTGPATPVTISLTCHAGAGDRPFYQLESTPSHGALSGFDPYAGTMLYTPDRGYTGPDSFAFRGTGDGGISTTATVSLIINPPPPATGMVPTTVPITVTPAGGHPSSAAIAGRPTASHLSLTGIDRHEVRLRLTLAAGRGAPGLTRVTITLPAGLSFVKRALARGLTITTPTGRARHFSYQAAGRTLSVSLKHPPRSSRW